MMNCSTDSLVGYLYDELPAGERAGFEAHLRSCAACREELAELRGTRVHLSTWSPPDPELGLRVIRGGASAPPPPVWRFPNAPAWGLAAAAVLVLAAAAAVANLEVRFGSDGLLVRTGWNNTAPANPEPANPAGETALVSAPDAGLDAATRAQIAALEERLRELESEAQRRDALAPAAVALGPRMSDAELLRRVRALVEDSEARQQRELALRLAQVINDFDTVRRTDLARIQQGLGRLQGVTGAEVAQQREMLQYLYRVASQQQRD